MDDSAAEVAEALAECLRLTSQMHVNVQESDLGEGNFFVSVALNAITSSVATFHVSKRGEANVLAHAGDYWQGWADAALAGWHHFHV